MQPEPNRSDPKSSHPKYSLWVCLAVGVDVCVIIVLHLPGFFGSVPLWGGLFLSATAPGGAQRGAGQGEAVAATHGTVVGHAERDARTEVALLPFQQFSFGPRGKRLIFRRCYDLL